MNCEKCKYKWSTNDTECPRCGHNTCSISFSTAEAQELERKTKEHEMGVWKDFMCAAMCMTDAIEHDAQLADTALNEYRKRWK